VSSFHLLPGDDGGVNFFGAGAFQDLGALEHGGTGGGDIINKENGFILDSDWGG